MLRILRRCFKSSKRLLFLLWLGLGFFLLWLVLLLFLILGHFLRLLFFFLRFLRRLIEFLLFGISRIFFGASCLTFLEFFLKFCLLFLNLIKLLRLKLHVSSLVIWHAAVNLIDKFQINGYLKHSVVFVGLILNHVRKHAFSLYGFGHLLPHQHTRL